jgi:hypothetical protein
MYKDKNKAKEYAKQYRIKNREHLLQVGREYTKRNSIKIALYKKEHYQNNRGRYAELQKKWRAKNIRCYIKALGSWEGFIPKETNCQICGKIIYFNNRNHKTAIHFDHRRKNEPIQGSPAIWLRNSKRTTEREVVWKSCDFGMLCEKCNRQLPTENRIEFLTKALAYSKL